LANQKQELPVAAMLGNGSQQNVHSKFRDLPTKFQVSDGLISKKSLKPLGQKNQNLVGRSSIKIAHLVPIR
jgi:hypothetical protein